MEALAQFQEEKIVNDEIDYKTRGLAAVRTFLKNRRYNILDDGLDEGVFSFVATDEERTGCIFIAVCIQANGKTYTEFDGTIDRSTFENDAFNYLSQNDIADSLMKTDTPLRFDTVHLRVLENGNCMLRHHASCLQHALTTDGDF